MTEDGLTSVEQKETNKKDRKWCVYENSREYLWNPSYFVATVSENTEEQIRKYIQNQKTK